MESFTGKLQLIAVLFLFSASTLQSQTIDYFGQTPPGDSATIFAPGVFSLPNRLESNIVFTPDGKEIYFGVVEYKDKRPFYKIFHSKYLGNNWTKQAEVPFSINNNVGDPYLSADGKSLYVEKKGDVWKLERTPEGWGDLVRLDSPINTDSYEGSYMETADGTAFIASKRLGGLGGMDIWRIKHLSDQSMQVENLGPKFNTSKFDYSPFMAPDGSYFIFGSYRKGKRGQADLFISFKKENNEWTDPINMNACGATINNTTAHHSNPSLSPDGKYLFFRRHESRTEMDVYWVNASVIDKLKDFALHKMTELKGDYLGQDLPGDQPLVFAPGIVSVDSTVEHGSPCFSPDGKSVFWQSNLRHKDKETEVFLKTMQCVEGKWTKPEDSAYGGMPAFSPDGKQLIFIPFGSKNEKGLYSISIENESWSQPKCMNIIARYPELKYLYAPSLTNNATLYFLGHAEGLGSKNNFAIYRSEYRNGQYAEPELLPSCINMPDGVLNWMPFIAPDESYLLFSSDRNKSQQDLYISFRQKDGSWTEAYNLGPEINTERGERFPYISPDGKYLFFTRWVEPGNEDVMWVSAKFIDELKKRYLK